MSIRQAPSRRRYVTSLGINHLQFVRDALRRSNFIDVKWFDLGLELELPCTQLKSIEDGCRSDSSRCLRECLSLWLTSAHARTWAMLASALERINQVAVAEIIRRTFATRSSQLVQKYSENLSRLQLSEESVDLLHTEGLVSWQTRSEIEDCGGFLLGDSIREICISVANDSEKLRVLGSILLKSDFSLANELLKDCDEVIHNQFPSNSSQSSERSTVTVQATSMQSVHEEVIVSEVYNSQFDEVQVKFGDLCHNIASMVVSNVSSAEDIKQYLLKCFPGLSNELAHITSVEGVLNAVERKCNIINVVPLRAIANRYSITEAEELIDEYQQAIDKFCCEIKLDLMLDKKLSLIASSLLCEKVEFILEWEPDEHSLDDIRRLLKKAFKDLKKRIIVRSIHEGHSVMIICYAPRHVLDPLILEAQANLTVLIKEFKLSRLSIGHIIILGKKATQEDIKSLVKDVELLDEEAQRLKNLHEECKGMVLRHEYNIKCLKLASESELKMKLLARQKFTKTILRLRNSEIQHLKSLLQTKAGQKEAVKANKEEIDLLQERISLASIQLLTSATTPGMHKTHQTVPRVTMTDVYIAQLDYHGHGENESFSFSKGEQLKISNSDSLVWWKGRSLESGHEGFIPSSYIRSNLELIQLFQFVMEEHHVCIPTIQTLKNQLINEDEKASLFIDSINDDDMLLIALREEQKLKMENITGNVNWSSDSLSLYNLSVSQCEGAVVQIMHSHYQSVSFSCLSPECVLTLLPCILQKKNSVKKLIIWSTPLTYDCILCLSGLLATNTSLKELIIRRSSISDKGVSCICKALQHNSKLTDLDLATNPHITSNSGQALSELIIVNSKLSYLNLKFASLSSESVKLILQSLAVNKSMRRLRVSPEHYEAFINNPCVDKRVEFG